MPLQREQSARSQPHPEQPGFVELLFDVVFVFAFNRFSERLVEQLTWFNFYATMVLLLAMWWVWYRMAWTTNRYDPQRPVIKLMVIVTMLASLLMAAALPGALHEYDRGLVFASIYVAVQTLRHLWLVLLGGDRTAQLVSLRIFFWALISAVPWIAGIFSQGGALTIAHPFGDAEAAWVVVIFGGPALFLTGRALLDYSAFSHVSWSRPIGLLLLAALAPAMLRLPLVLVALVAAVVLAGIAVANLVSWRIFPSVPGPPTNRPA